MAKFEVTVKEIEIYVFDEIEADNEMEAREKSYELLNTKGIKEDHHNDSDGEIIAIEIYPTY